MTESASVWSAAWDVLSFVCVCAVACELLEWVWKHVKRLLDDRH